MIAIVMFRSDQCNAMDDLKRKCAVQGKINCVFETIAIAAASSKRSNQNYRVVASGSLRNSFENAVTNYGGKHLYIFFSSVLLQIFKFRLVCSRATTIVSRCFCHFSDLAQRQYCLFVCLFYIRKKALPQRWLPPNSD